MAHPIMAATIGGLIYVILYLKHESWVNRLTHVFAAAMSGYFFAPVIINFYDVKVESVKGAVAALIGLIGISVLKIFLEVLTSWAEQLKAFPIVERILAYLPKRGQ